MKQISDKDWNKALDAMAEQAIFAAKLLAGEMPQDIEDAFKAARVSLFPSESDLETSCSCPDFANPCKHIAAVYYILGERFDEDPFLIFLLRGHSKEELMEMLRSRRADGAQPVTVDTDVKSASAVMEETPAIAADFSFWELKEPIDELRIDIRPPEVEMAALKRLGEPQFWDARKQFSKIFELIYNAMKIQD